MSETKIIEDKTSKDLWIKCTSCHSPLFKKIFEENLKVCDACSFHHKLTAWERVDMLTDAGSFEEVDSEIFSLDPLNFGTEYLSKMEKERSVTNLSDAVLTGRALIGGNKVLLGVMEFNFRGGSMGSVVGEKVARIIELAAEIEWPVIIVTASGGARMQEGMLSLMQMAKTSAAVAKLSKTSVPYISILTDPTTAGVAASYASLGDIIIAEPRAIIGFSGARVIEQTIRQKLPPGFQTSEFYLKHGMIDRVVDRRQLRDDLITLLNFFNN